MIYIQTICYIVFIFTGAFLLIWAFSEKEKYGYSKEEIKAYNEKQAQIRAAKEFEARINEIGKE